MAFYRKSSRAGKLTSDLLFRILFWYPIVQTFQALALACSVHVALEDPLLWIILWLFLTPFFGTLGVLLPGDVGDIDDLGHAAIVAFMTVIFIIMCIGHLRLFECFVTDTERTVDVTVLTYLICVICSVLGHLHEF
jgi:hypothetical protein